MATRRKLKRENLTPGALAAMAAVTHIDWIMDTLPNEHERFTFMRLLFVAMDEIVERKEKSAATIAAFRKGTIQ